MPTGDTVPDIANCNAASAREKQRSEVVGCFDFALVQCGQKRLLLPLDFFFFAMFEINCKSRATPLFVEF